MGKKSKRPGRQDRSRRGSRQPDTADVVTGAAAFDQLMTEFNIFAPAYERFRQAWLNYENSAHDVEAPELIGDIAAIDSGRLRQHLEHTRASFDVIRSGVPVKSTTPGGKNWIPPVGLGFLMWLVENADEGGLSFREQAAQNIALHERHEKQKQRAEAAVCSRGNNCKVRCVTWPGRESGPACWRHVTADEKSELSEIYDQAVETLECRGCLAAPGKQCREDSPQMQTVDGYFPRIRSFNSRKVHLVRLMDFADSQ